MAQGFWKMVRIFIPLVALLMNGVYAPLPPIPEEPEDFEESPPPSPPPEPTPPDSPTEEPDRPPTPYPHSHIRSTLRPVMQDVQQTNWGCTLWPGAAVIIQIDPLIGCPTSEACRVIFDAIKHYEKSTCVRFKVRSGERDYVNIAYDPKKQGCHAKVGRIGGRQTLFLGTDCWSREDVMHEFGHALGLPDEVTRPDRDKYIDIDFDNIRPECMKSYQKMAPPFPAIMDVRFDYQSIMMYGPYSSAKSSERPTLIPKKRIPITFARLRNRLSPGDVKKITKLYQCNGSSQDPTFPFDVKCSFDHNMCGFKNLDDVKWQLESGGSGTSNSHIHLDFKHATYRSARFASVNFHALSPRDKQRGSTGCVSFSYYNSANGPVSLQLLWMKLETPRQLVYRSRPFPVWTITKATRGWTTVEVLINVEVPFALVFRGQFKKKTTKGAIGLDNFVLSYVPCEYPTDPETQKSALKSFQKASVKSFKKAASINPVPGIFKKT